MPKHARFLLLFAYLVTLVHLAPASLAAWLMQKASDGRMLLANSQGSFWAGSGIPVIQPRPGEMLTLPRLHWRLDFGRIHVIELLLHLEWQDEPQAVPMQVVLTPRELRIRHLYLPLSAAWIGALSDFIKPAGLRGRILVRSDEIRFDGLAWHGRASAEWINASSLLSRIQSLGNYRLDFLAAAERLEISLRTMSGALELNGKGDIQYGRGLVFSGTAQATPGNEEALHELLGHLGPEVRPGVRSFNLVPGG